MKQFKNFGLAALLTVLFVTQPAIAQSNKAPPKALVPLDLQAASLSGERFMPQSLRGKVAIVFFWSTDCAVCRNSLPELRANLAGWREKPFALVTVNVDRSSTDWVAYEKILGKTQMPGKNLFSLHQDLSRSAPPKLPLTLLVNAQGMVVARYEGRLAPEAWDGVSDLLP